MNYDDGRTLGWKLREDVDQRLASAAELFRTGASLAEAADALAISRTAAHRLRLKLRSQGALEAGETNDAELVKL